MKEARKKIILNLVLGGIIFSIVLPFLFLPQPAHAQDLWAAIAWPFKWILDHAGKIGDFMQKQGVAALFKNAVQDFEKQILTESATWVATGGNEGEPLFFVDKDYWNKMADSIAAEFLDNTSKNFLGFSVCEEFNPQIKLGILFSLPVPTPITPFRPGDKRCSLTDIAANLTSAVTDLVGSFFTNFDKYSDFIDKLGKEVAGGTFRSSFISKKFAELISKEAELLIALKNYGNKVDNILSSNPVQGGPDEQELKKLQGIADGKLNEIAGKIKELKHFIFDCPPLPPRDFCARDCVQVCETPTAEYCAGPKNAQGEYTYGNVRNCLCALYSTNCDSLLPQVGPTQKWFNEFNDRHDDIVKQYKNIKTSISKEWSLRAEVQMNNKVGFTPLLEFSKEMAPENSVLGKIAKGSSDLSAKVNDAVQKNWSMQLLKGEWKSPTTKISKEPTQPAGATKQAAEGAADASKTTTAQKTPTGTSLDAVGLFLNTLVSKMYQQLTQGKLFGWQFTKPPEGGVVWETKWAQLFKEQNQPPPQICSPSQCTGPCQRCKNDGTMSVCDPTCPPCEEGCGEGRSGGRTTSGGTPLQPASPGELKAFYADVLSTPLKKGEIVSLISDFSQCPQDVRYALSNNCVIDTAFSRAIEQEMTIEEAMEKNYLHPDWYVSAKDSQKGNIDTKRDYSKSYSLTNATILAQAGIMPLGFQIAAQEISENTNEKIKGNQFALRDIVNGFYDENSPFYHLVNPNWRLKEFSAFCDLTGYSSIPQPGSSERQETCLQWRTCTGEKDDGTCHTYNYCTAYRNSWRFDADVCGQQYDSCQAYTRTEDGAKFAWLEKTLNTADCDANSIGCQWYCKNFNEDKSWNCARPGKEYKQCQFDPNNPTHKCEIETGCDCPNPYRACTIPKGSSYCFYEFPIPEKVFIENVIFFNRQVETCQATAEGCNQFIRTKENLGTNLLANSSFEEYSGVEPNVYPLGWRFSYAHGGWPDGAAGQFVFDETKAYAGKVFAKFTVDGYLSPSGTNLEFLPETKYVISLMAKNEDTADHEINIALVGAEISPEKPTIKKESSWQYFSFELKTPKNLDPNNNQYIYQIKIWSDGQGISLDNLQLESGSSPSANKDYGKNNIIYLKKSADPLCYKRDSAGKLVTSDPTCLNFVRSCLKTEVGCERYTPVNGDPYIPAIAKEEDVCPSECADYNSFREMPTTFYPPREVSFIPRTAQTCPANEVGCESYTNLEEVARGGESREFYSYLRPCQKPDGQCANFYIWVGSELQGYQLKKYFLRKDLDGTPAQILLSEKAEEIWGRCQGPEDAINNPNCREFYSEDAVISYRLYKNTITCNDTCLQLRKNKPISASSCWPFLFKDSNPVKNEPLVEGISFTTTGGESCPVSRGDQTCITLNKEVCDLGKTCIPIGDFGNNEPTCPCYTGICTFLTLPQESIQCSTASEGCREYKGNDANNIKISFRDTFEDGTYYPWQPFTSSSIIYNKDSLYFFGHSIKIRDKIPGGETGETSASNLPNVFAKFFKTQEAKAQAERGAERSVYNLVFKGKFYLLSFLAKGSAADQKIFAQFLPSNISFSSISVSQEWQLFNLGPIYFNEIPTVEEKLRIFSLNNFWLDNIQLKDTGSLYLIRNSWFTPSTCNDQNGTPTMIGCAQYSDRDNQPRYFKSFSKLCSDEVVGCEALINTQNSVSPFSENFNNDKTPPTDDITVPADKTEYLVYDKNLTCQSQDKGCQRFGLPALTPEGTSTTWSDVFLKNNPDLYESRPIICRQNQQGCEEFTVTSGGSAYFKYPGDKQCVWQEKVNVGNEVVSGWFQQNTTQPCYFNKIDGTPYKPKGVSYYGVRFSNDPEYDGSAGVCSDKEVGCKSFIDPLLTASSDYLLNGGFEEPDLPNHPLPENWSYSMNCKDGVCQRINYSQTMPRPSQASNLTAGAAGGDYLLEIIKSAQSPQQPNETDPRVVYKMEQSVMEQSVAGDPSAGANYLLSFDGYIESLPKYNYNWAGATFGLTYEGAKDEGELNACATNSKDWCNDWKEYYDNCNLEAGGDKDQYQEKCCNWVVGSLGNWDPDNQKCNNLPSTRGCQFGRNTSDASGLKSCIAAHYDWGYKPGTGYCSNNGNLCRSDVDCGSGTCKGGLSAWAWNYEHGYTTSGDLRMDSTQIKKWQQKSLKIEAGGEYNPRGLALKNISVGPLLSPPMWGGCNLNKTGSCDKDPSDPRSYPAGEIPWKCCSAVGHVYFDNFSLKTFDPYYLLDNLKLDKGGCNGKVSLEKGCVLFADEKLGVYSYNSAATYAKSQESKGAAVDPVDCEKKPFNPNPNNQNQGAQGYSFLDRLFLTFIGKASAQGVPVSGSCSVEPYKGTDYCKYCYPLGQSKNDTNLILKVSSTRVCYEWLHCTDKTKIWQKEMNDYIEACNNVVRCQRQVGEGDKAECVSIVNASNEPLTKDFYVKRDVSWFGVEPGGYSLYNWRPLELLDKKVADVTVGGSDIIPSQLLLTSKKDGIEVGVSENDCNNCPVETICQKNSQNNNICVAPLSPQATAEKDSPFNLRLASTFKNINVCEKGFIDCSMHDNQTACETPKINNQNLCTWYTDAASECLINCAALSQTSCGKYTDFYGCKWIAGVSPPCKRFDSGKNSCSSYDGANCVNAPPNTCWSDGTTCRKRYCIGIPREQCEIDPNCGWDETLNRCRVMNPVITEATEAELSYRYFSCRNNYTKAEYGSGGEMKKYFNTYFSSPANVSWPGICGAGDKDKIGKPCSSDSDCSSNKSSTNVLCNLLTKETTYYNKNNFCLSRDFSRPDFQELKSCLLWYPSAHLLTPKVLTDGHQIATYQSETLKGEIKDFGADVSAFGWFKWRKRNNGSAWGEWQETRDQRTLLKGQNTSFQTEISPLNPADEVEYTAIASNSAGTAEGDKPNPSFTFQANAFDFEFVDKDKQSLPGSLLSVDVPPGASVSIPFKIHNLTYPLSPPTSIALSLDGEPPTGITPNYPSTIGAFSGEYSDEIPLTITTEPGLVPGTYFFKIKGSLENGLWHDLTVAVNVYWYSYVAANWSFGVDASGHVLKAEIQSLKKFLSTSLMDTKFDQLARICLTPDNQYIFVVSYYQKFTTSHATISRINTTKDEVKASIQLPDSLKCRGTNHLACAATNDDVFITCDEDTSADKILRYRTEFGANEAAQFVGTNDLAEGPNDLIAEDKDGETSAYITYRNGYLARVKKSDNSLTESYVAWDSVGGIAKLGDFLYFTASTYVYSTYVQSINIVSPAFLFDPDGESEKDDEYTLNGNCYNGNSNPPPHYIPPTAITIGPRQPTSGSYYLFIGCQDNPDAVISGWKINDPDNNPTLPTNPLTLNKTCNNLPYTHDLISTKEFTDNGIRKFYLLATASSGDGLDYLYRVGNINNWMEDGEQCTSEQISRLDAGIPREAGMTDVCVFN